MDPEVLVVLGGKEFWEYGAALSCWSDYFDKALSSGMRESKNRRFEFPDKDPKVWEWIVSLMAPRSKEKVTPQKLSIALDWFDLLCCNVGLEECDDIMCSSVLPSGLKRDVYENPDEKLYKSDVDGVMAHLETTIKYNLKKSKATCVRAVKRALKECPFHLKKTGLEPVVSLIKENVECRSEFMGPLGLQFVDSKVGATRNLLQLCVLGIKGPEEMGMIIMLQNSKSHG